MTAYDEAARSLASGGGFDSFVRSTGRMWQWWANRLTRRDVPAWFDVDDARQELLIEAWRSAGRWSEDGGARASTWIAQSAIRATRKAVMRARGVNRHTWRWDDPGRYDVATGEIDADAVSVDAVQEDGLMGEALIREIADEHGLVAAIVVQAIALADGDLLRAATILYADPDARLLCRVGSEDAARRVVNATIEKVSRRR